MRSRCQSVEKLGFLPKFPIAPLFSNFDRQEGCFAPWLDCEKFQKNNGLGHLNASAKSNRDCPCSRITLRAKDSTSYLGRAVNRQPCLPRGMTRRGFPALRVAHRDGDCFLYRRATLYWHNSGANSLQKYMRIFQKVWHKILNISRPCGQILMKSCPAGAKTM